MIDGVMTKRAKVEVLDLDKKNNSSLLTLYFSLPDNISYFLFTKIYNNNKKSLKLVYITGVTLSI